MVDQPERDVAERAASAHLPAEPAGDGAGQPG